MKKLVFFFLLGLGFAHAQVTTLILVRHAEKLNTTDTSTLTDRGRARAQKLAELLRDADIEVVYSTKYVRTRETARPLAEARKLPVQTYDGHDAKFAETLRRQHRGQRVLVVGHSNTIPKLLNALAGTTRPDLGDAEYDAVFVVTLPERGTPVVLTLRLNP
jgi:2,3-bisphosphoglycerate-dependent phosphoglycerate mutase